jgi:hypothetical protein
MSDLRLTNTTQGVWGGKNNYSVVGFGLLCAYKDGHNVIDISVDTFSGSGQTYAKRDNPHIEILFPDEKGTRWTGTADELKKALFPNQ